jgi:hypothetical protein
MLEKGNRFPFDFRIDNVKIKGDTMVVIDFSEGGEGAGDVSFWKDSLIEFCWKKTKSRVDNSATSGSRILDRLIADAKVPGEMGMRLPSSLGQSPADYDGVCLMTSGKASHRTQKRISSKPFVSDPPDRPWPADVLPASGPPSFSAKPSAW